MPHKRRAISSGGTQVTKKTKTTNQSKDTAARTRQCYTRGFFKLPIELRTMIYKHLCVFPTRRAAVTDSDAFEGCPRRRKPEPAISRTCQDARNESLPTYYGRNTFAIMVSSKNLPKIQSWLEYVPKQYLKMVNDMYLIFNHRETAVDAATWVQWQNKYFSNDTVFNYGGNPHMSGVFTKMQSMAQELRSGGMSWLRVKKFMDECQDLINTTREQEDPGEYNKNEDYDEEKYHEARALHMEFCPHLAASAARACFCLHEEYEELRVCEEDDCACARYGSDLCSKCGCCH